MVQRPEQQRESAAFQCGRACGWDEFAFLSGTFGGTEADIEASWGRFLSGEWKRCRPLIVAALETSPGLETIEDVERLLADGTYQFWSTEKSAAITQIIEFQRHKTLIVHHGGGDLQDLLDIIEPALCEHARSIGCTMIMGTGRMGWKPTVEKRGYKFAYLTMYKELTE